MPLEPTAPSQAEELAARVLFAPLRQQHIVEELGRTGRVEAARLAADLGVSTESIRKDLTVLERRGLLQRVHGGAIARTQLTAEPPNGTRTAFAREKSAIAEAALAHVPAGGSILLDAGSTTARFAARLPNRALVVATTSLPVALAVARRSEITVHALGGVIRRSTLAGVGQVPQDALAAMNVDVVFLGTNGVSFTRGLTTPDEQEAMVKNRMLPAASRRILLVDHSKFGRESLWRHAELTDMDLVITDAGVDPADVAELEHAGVAVEIATGASRGS